MAGVPRDPIGLMLPHPAPDWVALVPKFFDQITFPFSSTATRFVRFGDDVKCACVIHTIFDIERLRVHIASAGKIALEVASTCIVLTAVFANAGST